MPAQAELIQRARKMRKNPTRAEGLLWSRLRRKQIEGRKFRRQHVLHPHIVDFYCVSEQLVVEIDGPIHDEESVSDHDERRSEFFLNHRRVDQVLRFPNTRVITQLDEVVDEIRDAVS